MFSWFTKQKWDAAGRGREGQDQHVSVMKEEPMRAARTKGKVGTIPGRQWQPYQALPLLADWGRVFGECGRSRLPPPRFAPFIRTSSFSKPKGTLEGAGVPKRGQGGKCPRGARADNAFPWPTCPWLTSFPELGLQSCEYLRGSKPH